MVLFYYEKNKRIKVKKMQNNIIKFYLKSVRLSILLTLTLIFICLSCSSKPKDTVIEQDWYHQKVSYQRIGEINKNTILVSKEVNLKGDTCQLPPKLRPTVEWRNY